MHITFEQIPEAIGRLQESQSRIEKMVAELTENISEGNHTSDQLLTVSEAAEFLTLSVPTIYSMVHHGKIPVNKKSKRLYFVKSELIDFIKSGRRKTFEKIELEPEQYLKPLKKRRHNNEK